MTLLVVLCLVELWVILGLVSLHVFSYIHTQKVQITDLSIIFLSLIYGPFTYGTMVNYYKEKE